MSIFDDQNLGRHEIVNATILPLDVQSFTYGACVYDWDSAQSVQLRIIEAPERFQLVSSLYGEGTVLAWFFVLASVLISWTKSPQLMCKDTISNDFIATLTMPVVAAGHCLYQIVNYRPQVHEEYQRVSPVESRLLTSWTAESVLFAAAVEAPLTICEDFVVIAFILFSVAANSGHRKRAICALAVGLLSLSPQLILFVQYFGVSPSEINFNRTFLFERIPAMVIVLLWEVLVLGIYVFEGLFTNLTPEPLDPESREPEAATRCLPRWLGSSVSAAVSAFVVGVAGVWVKFMWEIPMYASPSWHLRFVPKSGSSLLELDQAVATMGGFLTLCFSVAHAVKERRRQTQCQSRSRWRVLADEVCRTRD